MTKYGLGLLMRHAITLLLILVDGLIERDYNRLLVIKTDKKVLIK